MESEMKKIVPLSGIAAVGLLIVSFAVAGEPPDTDAPINEVTAFYTAHDGDQMASGFLGAYAALFFLFFAASLRKALRRGEGEGGGASALGFGGGILFAVGALTGAGLSFTLGDAADVLDPTAVQALHVMNMDFFFPLAAGAAAFLIGNGIAVLKTGGAGRIPSWLGWPGIVFGILAFSPVWFIGIPGMGLWVLATSILLFKSTDTA
jgi:hypothetical protein